MTIEQKAKRYDETLEQLKGLIEVTREDKCDIAEKDIIDIFHELKESEDEKIRNVLVDYFKRYKEQEECGIKTFYGIPTDNIIAWLEKQGEPTNINPSEFDLRLNKLLKQFETLPKEELANCLSFYLNVVQNDGTYKADEKQGEQKHVEWHREDEQNLNACLGYIPDEFLKRWLMDVIHVKYDKPVDKVEPKFHKGEWVVDNCGNVWKIEGIINQFYILECVEGGESRPTIEWVDKTFHLWTIQDAKDGDVLACENGWTCIFKTLVNDETFSSYCFMDNTKWFCETGSECHTLRDEFVKAYNGKIYPATKEQRDILMKAMADAGYTFDFEQKELKEIELTKSESEEELSDFEAALFSAFSDGWQQYLHGEEVDFAQWAKEHSAELLEAANQNHVAWSEEDEDIRDTIIRDLKRLGGDMVTVKPAYKEEVDWLKSLKQRIVWKPTKEQMEALHDLNLTGGISYAGQGQVLIELYNDLKKL